MPDIRWRAYQQQDLDDCLRLFRSNQQPYFAADEYEEYQQFLTEEVNAKTAPYFVLLDGNDVVGCGGYMRCDDAVFLTWGMLERSLHGQGLGRELINGRIEKIRAEFGSLPICIETSQFTAPIYQRLSFIEVKRTENGFGPGLHAVRMQLDGGECIIES